MLFTHVNRLSLSIWSLAPVSVRQKVLYDRMFVFFTQVHRLQQSILSLEPVSVRQIVLYECLFVFFTHVHRLSQSILCLEPVSVRQIVYFERKQTDVRFVLKTKLTAITYQCCIFILFSMFETSVCMEKYSILFVWKHSSYGKRLLCFNLLLYRRRLHSGNEIENSGYFLITPRIYQQDAQKSQQKITL